jgi:NAD(P) transhydrogenase subunit alpha
MKLGVLKEKAFKRVAIVPETIPKLQDLGLEIIVENNAGLTAMHDNDSYTEQGASVAKREQILEQADILLSIDPLSDEELKGLRKEIILLSQFEPFNDPEVTTKLQDLGLRAFSFDMIPGPPSLSRWISFLLWRPLPATKPFSKRRTTSLAISPC